MSVPQEIGKILDLGMVSQWPLYLKNKDVSNQISSRPMFLLIIRTIDDLNEVPYLELNIIWTSSYAIPYVFIRRFHNITRAA